MNSRGQLRWGGIWIMITSVLMNGMNIVVYLGYHNAAIQGVYAIGFTGLILACTFIHLAQASQSGLFGLFSYLLNVLSLAYSNVVTFLILAELSGIEGAQVTSLAIWHPTMRLAVYGIFPGLTLLGISVAIAGAFPRWSGILVALGVLLQLPAQYAMEIAGPLFFVFTIGGSLLAGAGLIWMGWTLWSGKGWNAVKPGLSNLDRAWGAPFVLLTGLILAVDAALNMFGGLSLASGITHLLSYTTLLLTSALLYSAHGERVRATGFAALLLTQLGAALYIIPAYLIVAQLSGAIDNNRMLTASWQDIPVGRIGSYLSILGMFLFGVEAVRSGVFPSWSGWLVMAGIALALPFAFTIQAYFLGIFWVLGAILEGIGIVRMAWSLVKKEPGKQVVQWNKSTA